MSDLGHEQPLHARTLWVRFDPDRAWPRARHWHTRELPKGV